MASKITAHVCFGNPADHLDSLKDAATDGSRVTWTINGAATPGDLAIFYMVRPLSSFVACGQVASDSWLNDDEDDDWHAHYMAEIKDITVFSSPRHIRDVRKAFPDWAWLRQPRRSTSVPGDIARRFLDFIQGTDTRHQFASDSDIEGVTIELLRLTSKRSRRLRDRALLESRGVCCVCDRDFSRLLDGRGVRVLQVHHRKQLSSLDVPRRTTLKDLAVVCANCHMLLHLDSERPLQINELRKMLRVDGRA